MKNPQALSISASAAIMTALVATMLICLPLASVGAEKRVALVIGNSAYQNVPHLKNPKNDALLIARTLKIVGFTLIGDGAQLNLDKAAVDRVVQDFGQRVQRADVALFYYAGHGVQVHGANYLVPTDANPVREADVDFQMVDVGLVLRQMDGPGTHLKFVILDACRNNPFGEGGLRGTESGLAQMRAPEGTLISYATQPGNVAQDGRDADSPYSKALAAAIQQPGLDVFQTFNSVGLAVERATRGEQQPWTSSSPIEGEFYFSGPVLSANAADFLTSNARTRRLRTPAGAGENFPNPEDFYPHSFVSKLLNERGLVVVNYCVNQYGMLSRPPTVAESSGYRRLDLAAIQVATAGSGHYTPGTEDGRPVPSCNKIGIYLKPTHRTQPTQPSPRN